MTTFDTSYTGHTTDHAAPSEPTSQGGAASPRRKTRKPRLTETPWQQMLNIEHFRAIAAAALRVRADALTRVPTDDRPRHTVEEGVDDAVGCLLFELADALDAGERGGPEWAG